MCPASGGVLSLAAQRILECAYESSSCVALDAVLQLLAALSQKHDHRLERLLSPEIV